MKTSSLLASLGLALAVSGCNPKNIQDNSSPQYESQSISIEGKTPIEKLDRSQLVNGTGYNVDFNGDGITDFVSMRDNRVYFSKGKTPEGLEKEIEIARINIPVIAYSIRTASDEKFPYLIFFDNQDNGYKQENFGPNANGIPLLGDLELEL
ncbi:hypothetical protein KA107_01940 [Candidatus Pacearchaeota archaeon]|nr:hypothetical protein [Candidatus Pacearchaeota archaeon]